MPIFFFIIIILFSIFVFQFFPFSGDEYSYIFQAKILESGKLYEDSPPQSEFFELQHVVNNGKWYSKYTAGWPLILSAGELLNLRWIVNPLIGIATLIALFFFTKFMFNEKIAYLSTIVMGASPFFIFNSASYFPHATSLFFTILFVFSYFLTLKKESYVFPIISGASFAMLFFIRPVDSFIIGIPLGIYSVMQFRKNKEFLRRFFVILATAAVLFLIPLYFNHVQNDNPLKFSYQVYKPNDKFTLLDNDYTKSINNTVRRFSFLLLWLPLTILIPFTKYNKLKLLFLSIIIMNVAVYFFYPFKAGDQFGPRYFYISFLSLAVLAGSSISRIKLDRKWLFALIIIINIPLNIYYAYDIHQEVVFRSQVYDSVEEKGVQNSLIFLKSSEAQGCSWYTRNSPGLDDNNLFVCDLGEKNEELIKAFPDKGIHFYDLKDMGEPYSGYSKRVSYG